MDAPAGVFAVRAGASFERRPTMLQKAWNTLRSLDDWIGIVLMGFIISLACANVVMRYVFGRPWAWVEEITVFSFVWLTMLGATAVIMHEGHCSIDVLARKLSPVWRRALDILINVIVLITLALLIYYGILLTIKGQTKLTPMLAIPYSYIDAAVPISCGIMVIYYLRLLWIDLTGGEVHKTQLEELISEVERKSSQEERV
jgi:TRAP-type C4-dicarboxylate transport system permease small subunit